MIYVADITILMSNFANFDNDQLCGITRPPGKPIASAWINDTAVP